MELLVNHNGERVIVGGAESLHRGPILRCFVELARAGTDRGETRIGILACATAKPLAEFEKLVAWFGEQGIQRSALVLLEISQVVPGWESGAWNPTQVAGVEGLAGLWLPGGDQNRTLGLLKDSDGRDSPLLAALRRRADLPGRLGGLVLGGTSAGAAVMSNPMIGGGTSFGALALPRATGPGGTEMSRALLVQPGLGLFAEGIVDQHFDARARLGRLIEAALVEDGGRRLAFGIDEATALVQRDGRLSVVGRGGVMVVDVRRASRDEADAGEGPRRRIRGVLLHYLTEGDSLDPATGIFDFGDKEEVGPGDESFAYEGPEATGLLSPYGTLAPFVARMLLDNDPRLLFRDEAGRTYARSLVAEETPGPEGPRLQAWELRFFREAGSRLFFSGRFSFSGVGLDIVPIKIEISRPL
jgi:cyanophycinase